MSCLSRIRSWHSICRKKSHEKRDQSRTHKFLWDESIRVEFNLSLLQSFLLSHFGSISWLKISLFAVAYETSNIQILTKLSTTFCDVFAESFEILLWYYYHFHPLWLSTEHEKNEHQKFDSLLVSCVVPLLRLILVSLFMALVRSFSSLHTIDSDLITYKSQSQWIKTKQRHHPIQHIARVWVFGVLKRIPHHHINLVDVDFKTCVDSWGGKKNITMNKRRCQSDDCRLNNFYFFIRTSHSRFHCCFTSLALIVREIACKMWEVSWKFIRQTYFPRSNYLTAKYIHTVLLPCLEFEVSHITDELRVEISISYLLAVVVKLLISVESKIEHLILKWFPLLLKEINFELNSTRSTHQFHDFIYLTRFSFFSVSAHCLMEYQ